MNDYIKREDAIKAMARGLGIPYTDFIDVAERCMDDIPTADVVEVVRCKDCKHLDKGENDSESWCECVRIFGTYFDVSEDDFCSYGEKETE